MRVENRWSVMSRRCEEFGDDARGADSAGSRTRGEASPPEADGDDDELSVTGAGARAPFEGAQERVNELVGEGGEAEQLFAGRRSGKSHAEAEEEVPQLCEARRDHLNLGSTFRVGLAVRGGRGGRYGGATGGRRLVQEFTNDLRGAERMLVDSAQQVDVGASFFEHVFERSRRRESRGWWCSRSARKFEEVQYVFLFLEGSGKIRANGQKNRG